MILCVAYSAIANVLDYTSGSFPVTFADQSLDPKISNYTPINLTDRAVWQTCERFTLRISLLTLRFCLLITTLVQITLISSMEPPSDFRSWVVGYKKNRSLP